MTKTRPQFRSFSKKCSNCFKSVFMYQMPNGRWVCVDDCSRLLRHYCIRSGGFQ
ncbi:MAG: hypothetical protein HOD60_08045 [Candidatus Nitrosopelagicus sp.]|nr:hypothetical protein [Candidatus Nitrosopelagicus sp.]